MHLRGSFPAKPGWMAKPANVLVATAPYNLTVSILRFPWAVLQTYDFRSTDPHAGGIVP